MVDSRMTGDPKPFDITIADPAARMTEFIDSYKNDPSYKGFEATLMHNTRVVAAEPASSDPQAEYLTRSTFEVDIVVGLCNPMQNMHGGAVALAADMLTSASAAPVARKGWWEFGGVSRTLTTTFLRPIKLGSTLVVECKVVSVGARMSVIQCVMRDKETGKLMAMAEHGKVAFEAQGKL